MALTYTPPLGTRGPMPIFQLDTVDGKTWSSQSISSAPAKVFVFMCNHCPYVKAIEDRLIQLARDLKAKGVPFIGICSNDPTDHPEDQPQALLQRWKEKNYGFPYLIDVQQNVARQFGAVCTPDFFVYDKRGDLVYRGRLDDSWKDSQKVTREELKEAVLKLLKNERLNQSEQIPSMGCSIKWRKE